LNISAWIWLARSQVGSRLAVASMAKINRPRWPGAATLGVIATLFRKSAISLDDDPYDHYPIPGVEQLIPGAATVDVLKAAKDGEYDDVATNAFYNPITGKKAFLSSEWGGIPLVGLTFDFTKVASRMIPQLPPLNGTLTDLLTWNNASVLSLPVVEELTDAVDYNIFNASLGVDLVPGQSFSMQVPAPTVEILSGNNPVPIARFRAGETRPFIMPGSGVRDEDCVNPDAVNCYTVRFVDNDRNRRRTASIASRHAEHVLADIAEDQVGRDRRDLVEARLAPFALDAVFLGEGKAAVGLHAGFAGLPGGL